MDVKDFREKLTQLNQRIKELVTESGFNRYDGLSEVFDSTDPETLFQRYELGKVMRYLEDASDAISYMTEKEVTEGTLYKNERGRYACGEYELSSGSSLEVYVYDEDNERYKWRKTRMEHDGDDYYIVGFDGSPNGVKARVRR